MLRTCTCMILCLGIVVAVSGCSGPVDDRPARVAAEGSVTYDGSPVDAANVTFSPKDGAGAAASATTDAQGKFTLATFDPGDGAIPGSYTVMVSKMKTEGEIAPNESDDPDAYREFRRKMEAGEIEPPTVVDLLPTKYKTADKTDLTADVSEGGPNSFSFELKDE